MSWAFEIDPSHGLRAASAGNLFPGALLFGQLSPGSEPIPVEPPVYVVQARFIGDARQIVAADDHLLYLNERSHWECVENAMTFATRESAEAVAQERRGQLRFHGNPCVNFSIVEVERPSSS